MMLRTFIQAVVYNYSVLKEEGDEAGVKAKGKVLTKGKDYVVEDGDILLFKFGFDSSLPWHPGRIANLSTAPARHN